jgi:hypothetical protein
MLGPLASPWRVDLNTPGHMKLFYRPDRACDEGYCDAVYFIQTVHIEGRDATTGLITPLTYSDLKWTNALWRESMRATGPSGIRYRIDKASPFSDNPYYSIPHGIGTDPNDPKTDVVRGMWDGYEMIEAYMDDHPQFGDPTYPENISEMVWTFEANVFCAAGDGTGKWLGRVRWQWTRLKGAPTILGTVSLLENPSRLAPTEDFLYALNTWLTAPGVDFVLPPAYTPRFGGLSCFGGAY